MKRNNQTLNTSEKLRTEKPSKLLWNLSIPAMVGLFVMALFNVVDIFFISYAEGVDAVAGLTVAFPVMMIVMTLSSAVGIGAASIISRRLGEKRDEDANMVFGTFIFLILIISFISLILGVFFLEDILLLFGATENIMDYAYDYMLPILLGFLFIGFQMATNSLLRSEGNATFAMKATIIPAIINLILDPIFIFDFGLGLGVLGAGIATVVSQGIMSVFIFLYYYKGKSTLSFQLRNVRFRVSVAKEITTIGFPAFVQSASNSLIMVAINAMLIQHGGDMYLAAFGIVQRLIGFAVMPMIGVMQGMLPIVGYNYGAKQFQKMRETIWLSFKFVVINSILVVILVFLFPEHGMRIFTDDPTFIEIGSDAMKVMFACFFVVGVQIIAGGIYQALGKPKPALILSLSRQVIFLIPLVIILPSFFGVTGVFLAFPISDFLAFLLSSYLLYRDRDTILVKGKNEDTICLPDSIKEIT
ncbi:MATE family efflux transporter [Halalkalibacter okhensis]|uniref:Multidrug export protein MepA n=1 Tax=Halalkalibacter okhensis TaxID=333138 RepID=A0A0B0IKX2_9BACI|nr:MATE family efflux transporter [Halalkalibacter okhensis]KHF41537.1 multidrug transporter MatE [Halalkalibacter okhensis]